MVNADLAVRPFSKLVGIDANTEQLIELKDTAGALIPCNYISVVVSNGPAVGPYYVRLNIDSVDGEGDYSVDNLDLSAATGIETRAGLGGHAGLVESSEPITITVTKEDAFNTVTIGNTSNLDCNFVITYGVVTGISTHRGHLARRGN